MGVFGNGAALESGIVEGNVIIRSGDRNHAGLNIGTSQERNSIANVYVGNNTVTNPITRGVTIKKGTNIVIQNNHLDGANLPGFIIQPEAAGNGIFIGNTATNISSGDPDQLASTDTYTVIHPILAAKYKSVFGKATVETCEEGGQDLGTISDGDYSVYPDIDLTGAVTFIARVASAGGGGTISVCLDDPASSPVATCAISATGSDQTWATCSCPLNTVSGKHDVYLIYHGTGKNLLRLEWFAFTPSP